MNTNLSDEDEVTNEDITIEKLVEIMQSDPNYAVSDMFKTALAKITQLLTDQGKIDADDVVTLELIPDRRRRQAETSSDTLRGVLSIKIIKNVDGENGTEEQVSANIVESLGGAFN